MHRSASVCVSTHATRAIGALGVGVMEQLLRNIISPSTYESSIIVNNIATSLLSFVVLVGGDGLFSGHFVLTSK